MSSSIAIPVQKAMSKRWMLWIGWVLSLWPVFVVGMSATWKLTHNPWYVREWGRIGYSL
jgi:hypothetical protein